MIRFPAEEPDQAGGRHELPIVVTVMVVMPGLGMVFVPVIREWFWPAKFYDKFFDVLLVVMILLHPIRFVLNAWKLDVLRGVIWFLSVGKLLLLKVWSLRELLKLTALRSIVDDYAGVFGTALLVVVFLLV